MGWKFKIEPISTYEGNKRQPERALEMCAGSRFFTNHASVSETAAWKMTEWLTEGST